MPDDKDKKKAKKARKKWAALEERITRLEDIEAIKRMLARYAQGADRNNDPNVLRELYTEDAVWEAEGFGRHEGLREITEWAAKVGREQILWSLHYMVSPLIEISPDGTTAACFWYLWELSQMPGPGGRRQDTFIGGWYETQLVKESWGAWKFRRVKLVIRLITPAQRPWKLA